MTTIQVITAVLNPDEALLITARSLRMQTSPRWHWHIANGGADTPALAHVRALGDPRIVVASQRDTGIYDAWNNACAASRADWTLFLGAGDCLASADVIELVHDALSGIDPTTPRLAFGHCRLVSPSGRHVVRVQVNNWQAMRGRYRYGKPSLPVHPETFHSAGLLAAQPPFDASYSIAGDVDIMLRAVRASEPVTLPFVVADVLMGGRSQDPRAGFAILREVRRACRENGFAVPPAARASEFARTLAKYAAERVLGASRYARMKEAVSRLMHPAPRHP